MSDTTRNQILQYLAQKHYATSREMCQALRITHADVRYHVNNLLSENIIVCSLGKTVPVGRGRPARRYSLAPSNQAEYMSLLFDVLISLYACEFPQDYQERVAYALAKKMDAASGQVEAGLISLRLSQIINILNYYKYSAQWVASSSGPDIYLASCPFAEIRDKHPEICEIDRLLLSKLIGYTLHLSQTNNLDDYQGPCKFKIMMK